LLSKKLKKLVKYINPIMFMFHITSETVSKLSVFESMYEKGIKKNKGRILKYVKTVFKIENRTILFLSSGVNKKDLIFKKGSV
jgi:hypothetical protein